MRICPYLALSEAFSEEVMAGVVTQNCPTAPMARARFSDVSAVQRRWVLC